MAAERAVDVEEVAAAATIVSDATQEVVAEAEVVEAEVEAVRNAPSVCTTCGATLPPLARGVTELTCEYCGTVVRV